MVEVEATQVSGICDARFEPVRDALAEQLSSGNELGASVVVDVDGTTVVDIWGGWSDAAHSAPWTEHTITNVWSTTKTVTNLAALMLVERGQLDAYAPVATYWPEFAESGKERIEVRHLPQPHVRRFRLGGAVRDRGHVRLGPLDHEARRAGTVVAAGYRVGLPRPEPGAPRR